MRVSDEFRAVLEEIKERRRLDNIADVIRVLAMEEKDRVDGRPSTGDLANAVNALANVVKAAEGTPSRAKDVKTRRRTS